jgi:LPS-assembly lipoprotein
MGAAVLAASGCGFRIRGFDLQLPFKSIAIQGSGGIVDELRQSILGQPNMKLVQKPIEAEVILTVATPQLERTVVAFSSAGRPREIQLRMRTSFRVTDRYLVELGPPQDITQYRDITVSESEILALANAENLMINDMHRDIAQQILRRLRAVQLPAP